MRIISLTLNGYRRMALNNVRSFTINPVEQIQLILGTNGSGKSSMMRELSPLPADAIDFFKDGSKTIKLLNKGYVYTLISTFAPTTRHTFLKNEENLNPGFTASVQKELVRQEFGLTPMIHELLIGSETFHNMTPARRREWFTILSDINYDYALSVYGKLKERSRDCSGALKLARKRLVVEIAKVISVAEEKRLQEELDAIHLELNLLITQSAPLDRPVQSYKDAQTTSLETLALLSKKLLKTSLVAPYGAQIGKLEERDEWGVIITPSIMSISDFDQAIDAVRHKITAKETLIHKSALEHTKLSDTVKLLMKTGAEGVTALRSKLDLACIAKTEILAKRRLGIEGIHATNAASALASVYELLVGTFTAIPENEDRRFSQIRFKELSQDLLNAKDNRNKLLQTLNQLASRKIHLEAHRANGTTNCPKCMHTWIVGYNDQQYQSVLETLDVQEEVIKKTDIEISVLELDLVAIRDYIEHYKDFTRCVQNWPALTPFWNYLIEGGYVTRSPRKALSLLEIFRVDLEHECAAKIFDEQINEVLDLIDDAESLGDANLSELEFRVTEVVETVNELTSELTALRIVLGGYIQYRRQLTEALELGVRIETLIASVTQINTDLIEMVRRETLNHCVRQLQHSLALKQTTLTTALLQKGIISDLETQIVSLTIEEEAARLLVKQLSPTDGLIAEGLLGFIRNFTGKMNSIIRKIWSYPLQIQSCGISNASGAELDYKFSLLQDSTTVVPDVRQGSSGMHEIINLAFKIVAMQYLKLSEGPLMLDEFGKTLDAEHRVAASSAIKSLMDTQSFTQLFMISHYEAGYGSFTNAETCVLDARNISIPTKYNQHVTMT